MTSTFRTAGAWGGGVGRPLTWAEQDQNMYDKETRLAGLEVGGSAVGIANIEVVGGVLVITMTDLSQYTFDLSQLTVAWSAKGAWLPSHVYQALDTVSYGNAVYLVNIDHTSDTTFDPNAMEGTVPRYSLIFTFPVVPQGFDRTGSTFTPALEDANTYNRMINAAGCAVTIDPDVPFEPWTQLHFRDESSDTGANVTFAISSPGIINPQRGYLNETPGSGCTVTLKKVGATNAWDIFGLLAVDLS